MVEPSSILKFVIPITEGGFFDLGLIGEESVTGSSRMQFSSSEVEQFHLHPWLH